MIDVVGIGPGSCFFRTLEAQYTLEICDVIAGYTGYISLLAGEFPEKTRVETGMRGEVERCRDALRISREGKRVAMVCSGDAAVYGMASLLLELADEGDEVRVVPGVTACLSASARLGAPISGDFAAISLSNLLTPWAVIERRLEGAAAGDFVIALYNPSSQKRADHLRRACEILLQHRNADTPCGWAKHIGRAGECVRMLTLEELQGEAVDMFTTVIIGNSQTMLKHGRLVTPRGYRL